MVVISGGLLLSPNRVLWAYQSATFDESSQYGPRCVKHCDSVCLGSLLNGMLGQSHDCWGQHTGGNPPQTAASL